MQAAKMIRAWQQQMKSGLGYPSLMQVLQHVPSKASVHATMTVIEAGNRMCCKVRRVFAVMQ